MLELSVTKQLGNFAFAAEATLPSAGVVALFGRSGAGKTTLVNMLAGLLSPDSGRIAVAGRVLFDSAAGIDLPPERRRIGYVFQEGRLFPHLDVRSNLLYGHRRIPPAERAFKLPEIVDLLGIGHLLGRRPANLSGGEKQRVAIGRALLSNPRLLLLDEPLAALDAARKAEILPFIERLRDGLGLPIVYVSHDATEVLRLADRILLLEQGRVAAAGPVSEVFGRPELQRLIGAEEAGTVLSAVVAGRDETYGLTRLSFGEGGNLIVPEMGAPSGSTLRLRIRARDVALARGKPVEISVLNNLPAQIVAIHAAEGPYRDVEMVTAGVTLWARITARSVAELKLGIGQEVYAMVKAVSIDRQVFSRPAPPAAARAAET
ncbi:MAG TPA: molybdenum ABC transporter ATP-binding protein [Dongiaceae bacterium]